MKVEHMNQNKSGEFKLVDETTNDEVGEMTYVWQDEEVMIIDHTEIDPAYQGKNLGIELVKTAVEYARENNKKIIAMCPFAHAVFKNHEEFNDVIMR